MKLTRVLLRVAAAAAMSQWLSAQSPAPAPVKLLSWKMAYFYDQDFSSLTLHDIHHPGPGCILALGVERVKGKARPVSLRSTDRGKTWSITPLSTAGRSAFFLSERLGWLVTEDGIERSKDCGATWERVGKEKGLLRAWFRDESLGFAVGLRKKAVTTRDGGRSWTPLKPDNDPRAEPDRSVYAWVEFANEKSGAIVGWHTPERKGDNQFPVWMDPEAAQSRRQFPSLTLLLQTNDGGAAWQGFTASLMGRMTRFRSAPDGRGYALIEFDESFDYPAEVYRLDAGAKEAPRLYRDKTHAVSDLIVGRDGWLYLAGAETPGALRLPVPGKVRILRSKDQTLWTTDTVDYRATATRVYLAQSPDGQLVAATDTGMVLRLE